MLGWYLLVELIFFYILNSKETFLHFYFFVFSRVPSFSLYSFNVEDLHDVRLIGGLFFSSVDGDNLVASLAKSHLSSGLDDELEELVGSLERGHLVSNNTSGAVKLSDDGVGDRASEDGAARAVLRYQSGELARVGEDDDEVDLTVVNGTNGSGSDGFSGGNWGRGERSHVSEESLVVNGSLCFTADSGHDSDGLEGVGSVSTLTGEHDAISSIEDGVSDIRSFGTGGTRSADHGLEHLGGGNNGLSGKVGLLDHPFLGNENLLWGNFHTKITTGDHDTVSGLKDFVVVVKTFLVLNLGDNLDVSSSGSEYVTDGFDILSLSNERGGNHINTMLEAEVNKIILILFSESGEVDNSSGQVHVLSLSEGAVVLNSALNSIFEELSDGASKRSISNVHGGSDVDGGGERLIRASNLLRVSLEIVISGDFEGLSSNEADFAFG